MIRSYLLSLFISMILLTGICACSSTAPVSPTANSDNAPFDQPQGSITATSTQIPETLSPINTPSPALVPTPISTPVPTLASHQWTATEELISFGSQGGDGSCGIFHPDLILLSDGQVFFWKKIDQDTRIWQTTKLSRQDTCKLLNSVDQDGFFDYDPATYITDPQVMGADETIISVQAWRSKSIKLYDLTFSMVSYELGCKDCQNPGFFTLLPVLRKTYQLLANYQPANSEGYRSDRLGVWVDPEYGQPENPVPWSVKTINLSKIVPRAGNTGKPDFILTGADAATVYHLTTQTGGLCSANVVSVTEGGKVYQLVVQYLMPYEYQQNTPLSKSLSCSPTDGWLEVP